MRIEPVLDALEVLQEPKGLQLDVSSLPTLADLSTSHWPLDQQGQLAAAVDGIRSTPWFQAFCPPESHDSLRVATAFAFAAFAHIRRRPGRELASNEELMKDTPGMGR
jgi:hypothetical protein